MGLSAGLTTLSLATFVLLAGAGAESTPQNRGDDIQLRSVKNLRCSFTASAFGTWPDGEPRAEVGAAGEPLTLTISKIDLDEESATIVDRDGQSTANAKLSGSNLYFLDLRPDGPAFLTTVFAQESRDKRLKATHSRTHPAVAVYYGDCEVIG